MDTGPSRFFGVGVGGKPVQSTGVQGVEGVRGRAAEQDRLYHSAGKGRTEVCVWTNRAAHCKVRAEQPVSEITSEFHS